MIREKRKRTGPIIIDLTGPEGNAFYLLGTAIDLSRQLGLNSEKVCEEMKESDYENLIKVFDKYFGDYVILER